MHVGEQCIFTTVVAVAVAVQQLVKLYRQIKTAATLDQSNHMAVPDPHVRHCLISEFPGGVEPDNGEWSENNSFQRKDREKTSYIMT